MDAADEIMLEMKRAYERTRIEGSIKKLHGAAHDVMVYVERFPDSALPRERDIADQARQLIARMRLL